MQASTYLCYFGVRPEWQGRGIGTRLLEAVLERAAADPQSKGVVFHTLNARLADSLGRRGWKVESATAMDGIDVHTCFRACAAPAAES